MYQSSTLKHQVIDTIIDPDAFHYLSEQQGIDHIADGPHPIVVEPPQYANAIDDEITHFNNILSIEELAEEQKYTYVKDFFNQKNQQQLSNN